MEGIVSGKLQKPVFVLIYGPDKVGKSTFGAEAPNPIFLGPEDGTSELDVARFPSAKSYEEIRGQVRRLINEEHNYKTAVLDSLDWAEPMIWKTVCMADKYQPDHIEKVDGGFQKGYKYAIPVWRHLINDLNELREKKKMNLIVVAHAMVKTFNDPAQPLPYDRWILKMHPEAAALWRESVDAILFANWEITVSKANKNDKKGKAYGDDKRIMYTQRRPSFDAGNRYGLPFELPLGWQHFHEARLAGRPDSMETVMAEINQYLTDPRLAAKKPNILAAITKANNNITDLVKIRNHARVIAGDE